MAFTPLQGGDYGTDAVPPPVPPPDKATGYPPGYSFDPSTGALVPPGYAPPPAKPTSGGTHSGGSSGGTHTGGTTSSSGGTHRSGSSGSTSAGSTRSSSSGTITSSSPPLSSYVPGPPSMDDYDVTAGYPIYGPQYGNVEYLGQASATATAAEIGAMGSDTAGGGIVPVDWTATPRAARGTHPANAGTPITSVTIAGITSHERRSHPDTPIIVRPHRRYA